MTPNQILFDRNKDFAKNFDSGEMGALPKLGTLILTCIDARVDPAHIFGLQLGDAIVFRNNGGRVTPSFLEEVAALTVLVKKLTGEEEVGFNIILLQHTKCGAQSFADPNLQALIKQKTNVDVSANAISDHETDLRKDIISLRDNASLPDGITVSANIYDVETGVVREIAPKRSLAELRA